MNDRLPPPHWTPTGNSGEWRWIENDKNSNGGAWGWFDDAQGRLELSKYKKAKKNWWQKLIDFRLTSK